MRRGAARAAWVTLGLALLTVSIAAQSSGQPVIVVETSRGSFAFAMYLDEAPITVKHVLDLVQRRFYDGQRFHRAIPGFVVQWGDPQSRDLSSEALWGHGSGAASGSPVGVAELSQKQTHIKGAVAMAHPGNPALADSQLYVTLADRIDLNGRYAVVGHVTDGLDVLERIQRGDVISRMYVRD
jgi:peptidyl-prolyl cis-trans isomerase B (cyclophilin B)